MVLHELRIFDGSMKLKMKSKHWRFGIPIGGGGQYHAGIIGDGEHGGDGDLMGPTGPVSS